MSPLLLQSLVHHSQLFHCPLKHWYSCLFTPVSLFTSYFQLHSISALPYHYAPIVSYKSTPECSISFVGILSSPFQLSHHLHHNILLIFLYSLFLFFHHIISLLSYCKISSFSISQASFSIMLFISLAFLHVPLLLCTSMLLVASNLFKRINVVHDGCLCMKNNNN